MAYICIVAACSAFCVFVSFFSTSRLVRRRWLKFSVRATLVLGLLNLGAFVERAYLGDRGLPQSQPTASSLLVMGIVMLTLYGSLVPLYMRLGRYRRIRRAVQETQASLDQRYEPSSWRDFG